MGFLDRKPTSAVGIDISTSAIKMLELRKQGKGYRVESYAAVPLADDVVVDHQIKEIEAVGTAIAKAVERSRSKTKQAAVALAGSQVISKTLTMPAGLSDDELEQQIAIEADHYIPFPLDEVNFDFEVLGPVDGEEGQVEVLLVASRTEQVEQRVAALEVGGLLPQVVDVEPFVMENAAYLLRHQMPNDGEGATVALFDVGATTASATILHDLKAVYTREQVFGGRQLTDEIMDRYGLTFAEAGLAKKTGEGLPEGYQQEVIQPFVADLVQVVNRALQLFYSSTPRYGKVDMVILAGGVATMPNVAEMVEEHLDVACVVANPFQDMQVSTHANPNALERDMPALMIAAGLAMRGLD
jgi:type IV pilus assembly protein PilM